MAENGILLDIKFTCHSGKLPSIIHLFMVKNAIIKVQRPGQIQYLGFQLHNPLL